MGGREVAWAIVGVCIGLRAVVRARSAVADLRRSGEVFGESHLTDSTVLSAAVALVGAIVCVRLGFVFEGNLTVLAHLVFVSTCLRLALIDFDTHVLPRRTTYAAIALGVPLLILARIFDGSGSLATAFVGAVALFASFKVLHVVSRGDLGGGDVTLGLLLGLFTGFAGLWQVAIGVAVGFAAAGVFALAILVSRRGDRTTRFAFGPYLILGALLVVLR